MEIEGRPALKHFLHSSANFKTWGSKVVSQATGIYSGYYQWFPRDDPRGGLTHQCFEQLFLHIGNPDSGGQPTFCHYHCTSSYQSPQSLFAVNAQHYGVPHTLNGFHYSCLYHVPPSESFHHIVGGLLIGIGMITALRFLLFCTWP